MGRNPSCIITGMTKQADLITYVFAEQLLNRREVVLLSGEVMRWMESSARFTAFVETYRDKIRKKVRVTREPESVLDLRSELHVAFSLLEDRRFAVAYEPYASSGKRSPDFGITYRANLVFNVEVAHLRLEEGYANEIDLARKSERVLRILLDKLGQMQTGMANLLVIHTQEELAQSIDLDGLMRTVKSRAEGKDTAFFASSRYTSPAAFYKDFLLLSGILLWAADGQTGTQLWINKQSRPGLAEKVLRQVLAVFLANPLSGTEKS